MCSSQIILLIDDLETPRKSPLKTILMFFCGSVTGLYRICFIIFLIETKPIMLISFYSKLIYCQIKLKLNFIVQQSVLVSYASEMWIFRCGTSEQFNEDFFI